MRHSSVRAITVSVSSTVSTMVVLAALTACGGPDASGSGKGQVSPGAAGSGSPAASSAAAAVAPPSPTRAKKRFAVGEVAEFDDGTSKVSAVLLAYTQPVAGPRPPDPVTQGGDVWATAEVKVCNTGGENFSVSQFPWSLAYEDGTRIKVTGLNGGDMPKPEFPSGDEVVKQGDCVRGKIPYPVPGDKRPARVVYAPQGLDEPIDWSVPAA
ncbi:DUF4352 domain-containing protein [Streptomyces sp. Isolate_45]|uniref:DUF4352 domain-containing protein n=1 Tax=Streptomyces sp. Isolate_45 TaxID=2950111 RepID=UPI002481C546|nr:DUF4352 domain-containing protein [Streptomyces sp. Isolate_45]MDA5284439.1 DUF4352 domain-containing protein [Streptomyces sp. Isolate_45]